MSVTVRPLLLCGLLLIPPGLAAADEPLLHYDTYLEGGIGVDDDGLGGGGVAVLPLWYDPASLLFADLRGVSDGNDRAGANLGVGFRHLTAADWIIGAYGFYDRLHLAGDAAINQGVLGIELMNANWELRVNGYLPESFERYAGVVSRDVQQEPAYLIYPWINNPNAFVATELTTHQVEGAYAGADFELGHLLREWNAGDVELRGYIGGFHFDRTGSTYESNNGGVMHFPGTVPDRHQSRFETITGPRLRAELRIYDLPTLGPQSRLVATGQYQWDAVRGSQGFLSIGVRVAFGDGSSPQLSRLRRRMLDAIPRQPAVIERGSWRETQTYFYVRAIRDELIDITEPTIILLDDSNLRRR